MKLLSYSPKVLLQINKSVIENKSSYRLDNCTWTNLKELNINKRMRGSRAGRNKIRQINNLVTSRFEGSHDCTQTPSDDCVQTP